MKFTKELWSVCVFCFVSEHFCDINSLKPLLLNFIFKNIFEWTVVSCIDFEKKLWFMQLCLIY